VPALKLQVSGVAILSIQFLIHTSSSICICLVWRICMMPDAFPMCEASASERVLAEPFWKAPRSPERSSRYESCQPCYRVMVLRKRVTPRVGGEPKIVAKRDPSVSNSPGKAFFRWTWTFIWARGKWRGFSRRAPQESDQRSTDFVLLRGVIFERVSFSPSFFHFFLRSDPQFCCPPEIGQGFLLHFCFLFALRHPFPVPNPKKN